MKQRLLMLVMTVMMMLGMTQTAFAEETKYYEGVMSWIFPMEADGTGEADVLSVTGKLENGIFGFDFTDSNGNQVEWRGRSMHTPAFFNVLSMNINGETVGTGAGFEFDEDFAAGAIVSRGNCADGTDFSFVAEFRLIGEPTEPDMHNIMTPFIGTVESDRGDYTLAIAGHFVKNLTDGTHVLTASDIAEQTIAIVACRPANGTKRVMRENTIEEMTVTVSGGAVTEYVIRGRVQIDGGTLDRYTAIINP